MPLAVLKSARPIPFAGDVVLMARLRAAGWALVTQASVSSISYAINDLTTGVQLGTGTLTVASVIQDTLNQSDGEWTADGPNVAAPETGYGFGNTLGADGAWGYSFRAQIPGATWAVAPAAQGDMIEIRVTLVMADAAATKMVLIFQFPSV